ncbi:MAG: HPr family phosphocarrier protein [Ruminococcaceae bacterium]|nr:HPr family phosphocarrier protein [Oscillospiraceae bacterium]
MLEKKLLLDHYDKVKKFVAVACSKDYDIELMSGKYVVNAKSIMGVFSLDLTRPVTMVAHCEMVADIMRQIKPFIFEEE